MNKKAIIKAGQIAIEAKKYARSFVKKGTPLLDIAEKIESKIIELGGKPAFPTNISINEVAAHYTPFYNDESLAHGLIKIDLGVSVEGWIADTAFSLDLENNEENKKLIEASKKALENAQKILKIGISTNEIGKIIEETIEAQGFLPIRNLSGHEMEKNELHAGLSIPNINEKKGMILKKGLYAIEPFATNGSGRVYDGKPSGIYILTDSKNIRSPIAREILNFILEEYYNLPFCSRWLVKKFGAKALFGLKQLEENGNLHHFPQLIEIGKGKVAQTENTILVEEEVRVTTKED